MSSLFSEGIEVLLLLTGVVGVVLVLLTFSHRKLWLIFTLLSTFTTPIPVPLLPGQIFSGMTLARTFGKAAQVFRDPLIRILSLISVCFLIAVLWSPSPSSGLAGFLIVLGLVAAVLLASLASKGDPALLLRRTMQLLLPIVLVQVFSTVVFYQDPQLEESYLRSPLANLILGDEARLLFTEFGNNVLDPEKAGGILFVNGNKASMVMAVWGLIYLSLWASRPKLLSLSLAASLVCFLGAVATGSKTGIILAAVLPLSALLFPLLVRGIRNGIGLIVGCVGFVGLMAGLVYAGGLASEFINRADTSAGDREKLWDAAGRYFSESPMTGLGFGGWSQAWGADAWQYGLPPTLPPHNFVISTWADAGLMAAILVVVFYLMLIVRYVRRIYRASGPGRSVMFSLQLAAIVWILLHGMFDNTGFYGTSHTVPILALLTVQVLRPEASWSSDPGTSAGQQSQQQATAVHS